MSLAKPIQQEFCQRLVDDANLRNIGLQHSTSRCCHASIVLDGSTRTTSPGPGADIRVSEGG